MIPYGLLDKSSTQGGWERDPRYTPLGPSMVEETLAAADTVATGERAVLTVGARRQMTDAQARHLSSRTGNPSTAPLHQYMERMKQQQALNEMMTRRRR